MSVFVSEDPDGEFAIPVTMSLTSNRNAFSTE